MNEDKLNAFLETIMTDLGGAASVAPVRMGGALGLYQAMHHKGPMTSDALARATGLAERYVREWLAHQTASGYVTYDADTGQFTLPEEHAAVLVDRDSPAYVFPAFEAVAAYLENQPKVQQAFRTGGGVLWGDQAGCIACAIAEFFRPGYKANLIDTWLPALDGVVEKLERGGRIADVGCGHGISTMIMAEAFPNAEVIGIDFHAPSIDEARGHAADHGGLDNLSFAVGLAEDLPGDDYDLITFFDCLHDMGDPVSAARRVRQALKPDGTWMIVEPFAEDRLEDNLTPVSRIYYAASLMTCVPASLGQDVGAALGAQAGEAKLREVVVDGGGFATMRRAAETPFNFILEARPQ
ncbi:class I SAM-dependent methyltransferase [Bauldia sp.]|uniref:class I SAM-dependent methyltransferase n=1 Tax=Bauldia sp. TaxID=2575872 RepID=UPI003BA8A3F6